MRKNIKIRNKEVITPSIRVAYKFSINRTTCGNKTDEFSALLEVEMCSPVFGRAALLTNSELIFAGGRLNVVVAPVLDAPLVRVAEEADDGTPRVDFDTKSVNTTSRSG